MTLVGAGPAQHRRVGYVPPGGGVLCLTAARHNIMARGLQVVVETRDRRGWILAEVVSLDGNWALADGGHTYYVLDRTDAGWFCVEDFSKPEYARWEASPAGRAANRPRA